MDTRQVTSAGLAFVLSAIVFTFVFATLFDSVALGVGPAIAVAAGIAGATYLSSRRT